MTISIFRFDVVLASLLLLKLSEGLSADFNPTWLPMEHTFSNFQGSSKGGKAMSWSHFQKLRDHDETRQFWLSLKNSNLNAMHNGFDTERRVTEASNGADLPLSGNTEKIGLYVVKIGLGSPPSNFSVNIDTGSDLFWVNCDASDVTTLTAPFKPSNSRTYQELSCNSTACFGFQSSSSTAGIGCPPTGAECLYSIEYGSYSRQTSGIFSSDTLHFPATNGTSIAATVLFGCSYNQSVFVNASAHLSDGILGLGRSSFAIPSVLSSELGFPDTFSHCLGGEGAGGGSLILGAQPTLQGTLQSTPMVDTNSTVLYYVGVTGVSLGGTALPGVDSSTFGLVENGQGTILDSGSTLALVPDVVYTAMTSKLVSSVRLQLLGFEHTSNMYCWVYPESTPVNLPSHFPNASIEFAGGSSMNIHPENYLYLTSLSGGGQAACYAWVNGSTYMFSVFGDIILRNKLVTYDNVNLVVTWADYNCSNPVSETPLSPQPPSSPQPASPTSSPLPPPPLPLPAPGASPPPFTAPAPAPTVLPSSPPPSPPPPPPPAIPSPSVMLLPPPASSAPLANAPPPPPTGPEANPTPPLSAESASPPPPAKSHSVKLPVGLWMLGLAAVVALLLS